MLVPVVDQFPSDGMAMAGGVWVNTGPVVRGLGSEVGRTADVLGLDVPLRGLLGSFPAEILFLGLMIYLIP